MVGCCALDDLHHAAFGAAIGAPPLDARQDVIAMHRVAQIVATDEEIAFDPRHRRIRHQKTVAIAMRHDASRDRFGSARA